MPTPPTDTRSPAGRDMPIPRDERRVSDPDFLLALDPRTPVFGTLLAATRKGDLSAARRALVHHFRTRSRPRWFFDLRGGRRGALPGSGVRLSGPDASVKLRTAIVRRADEICTNVVRLTGNLPYDLGPNLNWRTRELRGMTNLPSVFKGHGFIRDLAAAYALTGEPRYARQFDLMIGRWLHDWPLVVDEDMNANGLVFSRADGHKTMPTAGRWLVWMDALYSGIVFDPAVSIDTAFGLLRSLWFTALQYRRFAGTPHAPANHHLWSRGIMPVVFGSMLPEFPDLRALIAQGRPVIDWHARHGFLPDGGYEERSLSYALYVLRMYLLALAMERLNGGRAMGSQTRAAVRRAADALASLTLPNGTMPDIGDGGSSPAQVAAELDELAVCAGSRTAARVLHALGLGDRHPPDLRRRLSSRSAAALPLTVHMPQSGYLVARDGWRPNSSAMVLSLPSHGLASHAHDDALSLQFVVVGEPMVGTPYSELKAIVHQARHFHRQACGQLYAMTSHNLVLAGGKPLRHPRELTGRHGVPPTPVSALVTETRGGVSVTASHEGYPGTRVSRKVSFTHAKGWTVMDRVTGAGAGPHTARWHFEYGVQVSRKGRSFVARRGNACLTITYRSKDGCRARLYRDRRWLGRNPLRPGMPAPWILDLHFGGQELETTFDISMHST